MAVRPLDPESPAPLPRRIDALWHGLKVGFCRLRRAWRNRLQGGPRRWPAVAVPTLTTIIANVRTPLWTDGRPEEFQLVAGKVENLRRAVRAFDGVFVPARGEWSFWAQLGRPTRRRGFVVGREVIAGCVVPTIGGGLCQLSNALASAAQAAGIRLTERHAHSARPEHSPPSSPVDATVAWNHIDLRMQAAFDVRWSVRLEGDDLVVQVLARPDRVPTATPRHVPVLPTTPVARGCLTCNETACFRHGRRLAMEGARRALLLDAGTPELRAWLAQHEAGADVFCTRARPVPGAVHVATTASWARSLAMRTLGRRRGARQALVMRGARWVAASHAAALRPWHTELLIDQELLVPLWRAGVLAGRRYEVFLNQLPAREIQRRLDDAARRWPAADLVDFRVDEPWQHDELQGLAAARRRFTPHVEVAQVLQRQGLSVEQVPWVMPAPCPSRARESGTPPTLVFPASALPRKGAPAVAELARSLNARVLVLGTPSDDPTLWRGVDVQHGRYASDWLARGDVAVLPAVIEHSPRALLRALAAGMPVVASPACGLGDREGVVPVEPGDAAALRLAVESALRKSRP